MARNINVNDGSGDVFRAFMQWTDNNGDLKTYCEGPFPKRATAQQRISFWTKHMKEKYDTDITSRIDQGTTIWRPEGQDAPEMVDTAMLKRLLEQWGVEVLMYATTTTGSGIPIPAHRRTAKVLHSCRMQLKAALLGMKKVTE